VDLAMVAIEQEPHIGIKNYRQHRYRWAWDSIFKITLFRLGEENEADCVTQTLSMPHPSDSHISDPALNKNPTREEVKEMIK